MKTAKHTHRARRRVVSTGAIALLAGLGLALSTMAAQPGANRNPAAEAEAGKAPAKPPRYITNARKQGLKTYPCSECHDKVTSQTPLMPPRRPHSHLKFAHMEGVAQCYHCHNPDKMDTLRLLTGKAVSLDDSHLVCGQCHMQKRRDWDLGIHGKLVGSWRGPRFRYTCADCHDPHAPKRPKMKAMPAPPFPRLGIRKHDPAKDAKRGGGSSGKKSH